MGSVGGSVVGSVSSAAIVAASSLAAVQLSPEHRPMCNAMPGMDGFALSSDDNSSEEQSMGGGAALFQFELASQLSDDIAEQETIPTASTQLAAAHALDAEVAGAMPRAALLRAGAGAEAEYCSD